MGTAMKWLGIFDKRHVHMLMSWVWEKQGVARTGDVDAVVLKHLKADLDDTVSRIEGHGVLVIHHVANSQVALAGLGDDAVELELVLAKIKDIITTACHGSWDAKTILDNRTNLSLIIAEIITAGTVERLNLEMALKYSVKFVQIPVSKRKDTGVATGAGGVGG